MAILNILSISENLWLQQFGRYSHVGSSTFNEKGVETFLRCSQCIQILAHIPSCSMGSYYTITVGLPSPNLYAYKSKQGPRLNAIFVVVVPFYLSKLFIINSHTV